AVRVGQRAGAGRQEDVLLVEQRVVKRAQRIAAQAFAERPAVARGGAAATARGRRVPVDLLAGGSRLEADPAVAREVDLRPGVRVALAVEQAAVDLLVSREEAG